MDHSVHMKNSHVFSSRIILTISGKPHNSVNMKPFLRNDTVLHCLIYKNRFFLYRFFVWRVRLMHKTLSRAKLQQSKLRQKQLMFWFSSFFFVRVVDFQSCWFVDLSRNQTNQRDPIQRRGIISVDRNKIHRIYENKYLKTKSNKTCF